MPRGIEFARARDAIASAFSPTQFDRFLLETFDYRRVHHVQDGPFLDVVTGVLEAFAREGRDLSLLSEVAAARPDRQDIQAIHRRYEESLRLELPGPSPATGADRFLRFLAEALPDRADVERVLATIGSRLPGGWPWQAGHREGLARLIADADRERWIRLLLFGTHYDRRGRPGLMDLGEGALTRWEREGIRLAERLDELGVDAAAAADCYDRALTALSYRACRPPGAKPTLLLVAHAVVAAQEACSSDRPGPGDDRPLQRFLRHLAARGEAIASGLEELHETLAARCGWDGGLREDAGRDGDRYSVVVELKDGAAWSPGTPYWSRRAWLYRHGAGTWARLDDELEDRTETAATMPGYLSAICDRVARLTGHDVSQELIPFEIFLPRSRLGHGIDEWQVSVMGEFLVELGYQTPVVVRSLESGEARKAKLAARWKGLRDARSWHAERHLAFKERGGDPTAHLKEFLARRDLQCVVLKQPLPPDADPAREFPCVLAAIAAGVPAILWARDPSVVPRLSEEVSRWAEGPPRRLPELVHQLRQAADEGGDPRCRITLFFENGDYALPPEHQASEAR
ncbi:hypothetical protein OJF2_09630 [Aquisphaera giovannonii]|uniref:Uncharacterized protein n=1 Tax=Aquisphaera giovannonii TaxID=406548 RepID=A0A5B9VVL9_9BACT|nr:effector-associated domain EAD1-containing protein [Aquisphaera giovannonii]QEH32486.1 hypothetical protein OJF2_09630 [Aquisphaera giovannonii]